jgi:DNA-binding NarL/FixJ family response regulator
MSQPFEWAVEAAATSLSPREVAVLDLVAHGLSNKEIGSRLNVSQFTVKNHLARIFLKLQVRSRTGAVIAWAQRSCAGLKVPVLATSPASIKLGT